MNRWSGNCAGARSYPTGRTAIVPIENVAPLLIRPCQEIEETVGGLFRAPFVPRPGDLVWTMP